MINNARAAGRCRFDYSNNRFDPMVTLAVDAAPGINLYAKYSTGYRAGGANSRSSRFATFDPERSRRTRSALKTDLFDHRVRLNLAGYIMDRNDSQIDFDFSLVQPNGTIRHTLETVNAAGATKIRGRRGWT